MPISFYYSSCYYQHNRHRLHKRYQVSRGNTSWDISIRGLKWKGEPKFDIAFQEPKVKRFSKLYEPRSLLICSDCDEVEQDHDFDFGRWDPYGAEIIKNWVYELGQFKQYHALDIQLYNKSGIKTTPGFQSYAAGIKTKLAGPLIGPSKGPNFVERGPYINSVRWE